MFSKDDRRRIVTRYCGEHEENRGVKLLTVTCDSRGGEDMGNYAVNILEIVLGMYSWELLKGFAACV